MSRSEEVAPSEEVVPSEEVALSEEVAQSEEMAAAGLSVTVTHSERGLPGGLRAGPRKSGGVSGFGRLPSRSVCPCIWSPEAWDLVCVRGTGFFFFFTGLLSAHLSTWQVYFVSGHLLGP